MDRFKSSFIPGILWLILATILHCIPGEMIPRQDWINKLSLDKLVHISLFAALFLLWFWPLSRMYQQSLKSGKVMLWVGLAAVSYGVSMEFVQHYFVKHRSFEILDMIADSTGVLAGMFLVTIRKK